jgi:hypothetical protein
MSIRHMTVLFLIAAVLAIPSILLAQTERGTITGVVRDSTGAVVPGVSIRVANTATNVATNVVTSESGTYSAVNLSPGPYRVEASLSGFQSAHVTGITVTAGTTVRTDVTLNLGSVTETLNVVAEAAPLQTEDARIATSVSNKLIDELPLVVGGNMRSPYDLVATVPEARTNASLGGGQGRAYGATLDGISVNTNRNLDIAETALLAPSLEAITEFSVETNGFKPEYGQAAGGIVTFASKSGTNNLNGSLYEFHRNDALDKRNFFEQLLDQEKGIYKQNNFGVSLGGPVQIKRLYNGRDRTFFFATYEGFVNRQGSNSARFTVPTPEMFNGDFSKWVDANGRIIPIYDPATTRQNPNGPGLIRDPFPGNRIPQERFSAVAKNYIAMARSVLVPNVPGIVPGTLDWVDDNYVSSGGSTTETTHKFSAKVDHVLNSAHRISYLFNRTANKTLPGPTGTSDLPAPFSDFQQDTFDADLHRASWDWVGRNIVNHLSVGGNTFNKNAFSPNVLQGNWADRVCIPNTIDCNNNMGIISFNDGLSTWGSSSDNGTEQPRFTLKNDVTLLRGSHTFKTGFTWDQQQANGFGQQNIAGSAGFSFRQTGLPGSTTLATAGGSAFASFLLGHANSGQVDSPRHIAQQYPYYGFYAQDDWRVNSSLVINYGVRYEFTQPPYEKDDEYSEFSPTLPNPAINNYPGALIFAGEGPGRTGKRSLVKGYYGAIGPRASFAYSLNDKTIFRGGIGRSFGRATVIGSSNHLDGFVLRLPFSSPDGFSPSFTLDQGLPPYQQPPFLNPSVQNNSEVHYWNDQATIPARYDTWTLSFQRELRPGMTFEFDYNGSRGSRLNANLLNLNQVPLSAVEALAARFGKAQVNSVLQSQLNSTTGASTGVPTPYPNFNNAAVQTSRTVAQALRPFPQYTNINTQDSGGDKTGRSMYHAGIFKVNQRLRGGLTLQGSYVLSRLMTNADNFSGSNGSLDAARPELEYTIGANDQTHIIKISSIYELPFGEGRRWLTSGVASKVLGGWRLAAIQSYVSGTPIGVTSPAPLQISNRTNRPNLTGEPWRAPVGSGGFDPMRDKFLNRAAFVQPVGELGNAPRLNSDVRRFWNLSENISLAKTIGLTSDARLDVRFEAFNVFDRIIWGGPNTDLNNARFGEVTSQANSPRQMQLGLRLYW